MTTKEELRAAVKVAEQALATAQNAVAEFDDLPENNVYATLDEAAADLEDKLRDLAHKDCEGEHNCGASTYTREFMVDGAKYVGTLKVEYNRHDKTYYYIEEVEFTYKAAETVPAQRLT